MENQTHSKKEFCAECDRICCARPVVLPHERENIIMATKMGFFQRRKVFSKHGKHFIIEGDPCPFLKNGACSIEEIQPLNCKISPLALNNRGKDAEWGIWPNCPSSRKIPYEFIEHAKRLGQPLLEKHRKEGPLA